MCGTCLESHLIRSGSQGRGAGCVRRFGSRTVDEIDLWLQRRAFLRHAQRNPDWAVSYHAPARPMLYAYYAVKTGMGREMRWDLAGHIEASLRQKDFLSTERSEAVTLLRGM